MRPIDVPVGRLPHELTRQPGPWTVFSVTSVAVFLVSLDSTMLYAAFGALRAAFAGASAADLSWVLNAYTVVYAAMLIPAGGIADAYGRKRVFMAGAALFIASSAACGLAPTVPWLVAARVMQAIGAALLTPASLSLVLAAFPQSRRAIAVSAWGAVSALAAAVGPSLGSLVIATVGWEWAFYINVPIGGVALWRGARLLREERVASGRDGLDWVGMILVVAGVGALALAIVEAESPAWTSLELVIVTATGVVAMAGFARWVRAARRPLVDPALFAVPTYTYANLATFVFGMAFAIMFFAFFFYMRGIWHYSLPLAGVAIMPGPLLVIPVALVAGRLAGRFGHRPVLVAGSLVYAAAGLWFLTVPAIEPAYLTHWLPGLLLSGTGVGMVLPSLSGAAVARLPARQYAVGSAVNQATRQIGAVFGVAVTIALVGQAGLTRADFTPVYAIHIGLALLTALLCLPVNTRRAP